MSVEDYSKQLMSALTRLQIPERTNNHQRLGSFYEISDSPLVSPSMQKLDQEEGILRKLTDFEDSNVDSPLLSADDSYTEQYSKSISNKKQNFNHQSGKKTPFEIEQELLSELNQLENQDSGRQNQGYIITSNNYNENKFNLMEKNDENYDKRIMMNITMEDELQRRLEQKKIQIREGALSQGIRLVDMNKFSIDKKIYVNHQLKKEKKINNYLNSNESRGTFGLLQENLMFQKETPRFMEESERGHAKKLSNIDLNLEEIQKSSKILNYDQELFKQEDSNLLNSPDESEFDSKLVYDSNNIKSSTPEQSPSKRRRIHHFNQNSYDMRGINFGYSQDNTLDQISSIDDLNHSKDIERAKSDTRQPYYNDGMHSPSNVTSERNTFYQGNQFLRRDMQNDADDKNSDRTMQSVFNQYQSNNTSFVGISQGIDNDYSNKNLKDLYQLSGGKRMIQIIEEDIGDIDVKVEFNDLKDINQDNNEWTKIVNEAKDSLQRTEQHSLNQNQSQSMMNSQNLSNLEKNNTSTNIQRTFLRHLIKKQQQQDPTLLNLTTSNTQSTYTNKFFLNSDSNLLLEDCILFLTLIGRKNFHTYILSDQEANRQRILYSNLLKKNESHEAYLGLAKIYFHLNRLEQAYEFICKATQIKQNDGFYYLWQGFILYYLISYSSSRIKQEDQVHKVQKYLKEAEKALNKALKVNKSSIAIMFLLLKLSIWAEKNQKKYKFQFGRRAQDYAIKIQKLDKYMGYMAWSEIYISQRPKRQLGIQVLIDLIKEHNERPEAHLKLWYIYNLNSQHVKALEIAEKLFIYGTGVIQMSDAQEEISKAQNNVASNIILFRSCLITLLYAKSLFKNQEQYRCYELLQNQFMAFPWFFSLLFAYAKYVIESDQENFLGSAVGALEECLRSQIKERHSKINYYLGRAYNKMKQPVKVYEYWKIYYITSSRRQVNRRVEVKQTLDEYEEFCLLIQRVDNTIKQQQSTIAKAKITIIDLDGERYIEQLSKFASLDEQTRMLYIAKIYGYMLKDRSKASDQFEKLIKQFPTFLEGYLSYWKYLKANKQNQQALLIAEKATQLSESTKIPTSLWVEARLNLSKSQLVAKQVAKSIETLKEICYLLPPFPISELPFIDQVLQSKDEDIVLRLDQDDEGIRLRTPRDNGVEAKQYFSFAEGGHGDDSSHRRCESIQVVKVEDFQDQDQPNYYQEYKNTRKNLIVMQSLDSPFALSSQVEVLEIDDIEEGRATSQFNQDQDSVEPQKMKNVNQGNSDIQQFTIANKNLQVPGGQELLQNFNSQQSVLSVRQSFNYEAMINGHFDNIVALTQRPSNAQLSSARKRSSRFSFMNNSARKSIAGIEGILSFRNIIRESMASQSCTTQEDNKILMDSEGFAVYSNVQFLLQIGKIAAETGKCFEDGFNALNDYLSIIDYYRLDISEETYDQLKLKANYYQGLILYKGKDYEMAQQFLVEILMDLRDKGFKSKFETAQSKLSKMYRRQRRETIIDYFR